MQVAPPSRSYASTRQVWHADELRRSRQAKLHATFGWRRRLSRLRVVIGFLLSISTPSGDDYRSHTRRRHYGLNAPTDFALPLTLPPHRVTTRWPARAYEGGFRRDDCEMTRYPRAFLVIAGVAVDAYHRSYFICARARPRRLSFFSSSDDGDFARARRHELTGETKCAPPSLCARTMRAELLPFARLRAFARLLGAARAFLSRAPSFR